MLFDDYISNINDVLKNINKKDIEIFYERLLNAIELNEPILSFGNGGSSSIVEHLSCDFNKGVGENNKLNPFVINLPSNVALMTAISNDISYDEVFSKQIEWVKMDFCNVFAVSSSGNSENIVRALRTAKSKKYETFAMVGFDGGRVKSERLADNLIHVNVNDYQLIEDSHHILMHYLTKRLMKKN